jgi:DNA repair exonuclease SbcCD ATPase subunit
LFNSKKKRAAAEAQRATALRAERAAELEAERAAELQAQLDAALAEREALEQRLAALDHGVGAIGEELVKLASAHGVTNEHLRSIEDRVLAADVRVDAINHRLGDVETLTADLDAINQRLASFTSTPEPADAPLAQAPPPPPPPPAPSPPPPPSDDDTAERLVELRAQLDALTEATSAIDARVTGVSMELANQLTELGRDIDELNRRAAESAADGGAAEVDTAELEARITERLDAAIDDVLDSTERLAAEQARYEIRFRADLAELAERIRRPTS